VVTTGFANLSDGARVLVGKDDQTPSADLAPRKKRSSRDVQKDGQAKDGLGKEGSGERRAKRGEGGASEGDQKGQTGPAAGGGQLGGAAKSQP